MTTKRGRVPYLSLIIPAYNEHTRLLSGVSTAISYLKKQRYSWELILVDDGSVPSVVHVLRRGYRAKTFPYALDKLPIIIHRLPKNRGKGAALKAGVALGRGHLIVFSDVDLSVSITYLSPMLRALARYNIVIASRRLAKSDIIIHQSFGRELSGRIFTALSNIICNTQVADATCGFKGFQKVVAKEIFAQSRITRWVFDTEILFLARKRRWEIKEFGVAWANTSGSKVRPFDSVISFIDLFRIRWNDMRGRYDTKKA
ncbi:hypothetical protein A2Z00_03910 [Candidatus Gottesmanbacteria bacterium RBG_13_45_10]|uniref:Glycosyltransferase 2-like domain-containing protein n=1 Tax=Candidatus Gottesmanbacteria bacterium RBG_13_45_10 TaxID=1798370 RepID=A0A1F5ZIK7_9BACT|nr:MAG: hypothetical protein A2Z00_03910 [Candidatus Gottesmanbacteria bacterium RBG_13_45_10]